MAGHGRAEGVEIECLACGACRTVADLSVESIGECGCCGYLGWAEPAALSNTERSELHRSFDLRTFGGSRALRDHIAYGGC